MVRALAIFFACTTAALAVALAEFALANAQDGHKWRTLRADDGTVVGIDMTSLSIFNPSATSKGADVVLSFNDGTPYPLNMRRYIFYCGQGRYRDVSDSPSAPLLYAAPGSVAAKVSEIVCAGAGPTIVEQLKKPPTPSEEPPPRWQDYCKGFSEDACARIRKVVEAKITPSYCKPGFAVLPTSLTDEQLRICYVMPSLVNAPK